MGYQSLATHFDYLCHLNDHFVLYWGLGNQEHKKIILVVVITLRYTQKVIVRA